MKKNTNDNLYKFSIQTPWQFIFVVIIYLVGATSVPNDLFIFIFGESLVGSAISAFIVKSLCCILPIWLIKEIKCEKILTLRGFLSGLLIIIPFLLVAINNFPILPMINGECKVENEVSFWEWVSYLLAVLAGAALEEFAFRGLVFPTLMRKFEGHKYRDFLAVLVSSAAFGLVHAFNLLAGASPLSVLMQIGYSLLIGGMCAIAFLKTGNFYHAVILHFVFNIGGMLFNYGMVNGEIWTLQTIVITAALAVAVIIYALCILFICNKEKLSDKL